MDHGAQLLENEWDSYFTICNWQKTANLKGYWIKFEGENHSRFMADPPTAAIYSGHREMVEYILKIVPDIQWCWQSYAVSQHAIKKN